VKTAHEILREIDPSRLSESRARGANGPYGINELRSFASQLKIPVSGSKSVIIEQIRQKMKDSGLLK
jgi:hypothetical protein